MTRRTMLAAFALFAATPIVSAEQVIPTAVVTRANAFVLGGSYSENDAYAVHAAASIPFGKASTVDLGVGYNRSPLELADLATYRGNVGFDHDFEPVGLSIGYEYWGDRDFIETQTLRGSVYARGGHGRIALLTEFRDIKLDFDVPVGARGFVASSKSGQSKGVGASARYAGDVVDVYATGMHYDYDFKVGRLSSIIDLSRVPVAQRAAVIQRLDALVLILRRLNSSSVTLASSFLDYGVSAGVDIRFGDRTLNVELSRDKSITDGAVLDGGSIGFIHPLGGHSDIEYRAGVSNDEVVGSSVYGGVTFYWYR